MLQLIVSGHCVVINFDASRIPESSMVQNFLRTSVGLCLRVRRLRLRTYARALNSFKSLPILGGAAVGTRTKLVLPGGEMVRRSSIVSSSLHVSLTVNNQNQVVKHVHRMPMYRSGNWLNSTWLLTTLRNLAYSAHSVECMQQYSRKQSGHLWPGDSTHSLCQSKKILWGLQPGCDSYGDRLNTHAWSRNLWTSQNSELLLSDVWVPLITVQTAFTENLYFWVAQRKCRHISTPTWILPY